MHASRPGTQVQRPWMCMHQRPGNQAQRRVLKLLQAWTRLQPLPAQSEDLRLCAVALQLPCSKLLILVQTLQAPPRVGRRQLADSPP